VAEDPTDDELFALASELLQAVGEHLREPSALRETIAEHRSFWVMLYNVYAGRSIHGDLPK
jgi:hypothetical protein